MAKLLLELTEADTLMQESNGVQLWRLDRSEEAIAERMIWFNANVYFAIILLKNNYFFGYETRGVALKRYEQAVSYKPYIPIIKWCNEY